MVNLKFCVLRHLVRLLVGRTTNGSTFLLLIITWLSGSEIYVGCSNGEVIRFALQADDPNKVNFVFDLQRTILLIYNSQQESYTILSRQTLPGDKPIDEIVIIPSLLRALVLSGISVFIICLPSHGVTYFSSTDHQIHFFTIPSLSPFPINPIRHVVTFAVDDQHLKRPLPSLTPQGVRHPVESVDFCVVKRAGLAMYSLKDRLSYMKVSYILIFGCLG